MENLAFDFFHLMGGAQFSLGRFSMLKEKVSNRGSMGLQDYDMCEREKEKASGEICRKCHSRPFFLYWHKILFSEL